MPVIGAGVLLVAVALSPPVDHLAGDLFWVHMSQHLVLGLVAPLVLALARPLRSLRRWVRPSTALGVLALLGHSAAFWAWHVPPLYDGAVAHLPVHVVEHLSLLGTGLLLWWVLVTQAREGAPGTAVLLLFLAGLQGGALAALLTLAPSPLYRSHLATTAAWGLTPLEDQQLAGAIMWVPGGILYVAVAAVLFVRWLRAEPDRRGLPAAAAAAALVVGSLLTGCVAEGGRLSRGAVATRGDAGNGRAAIERYGCGSCHRIPGVRGADALVGPPLDSFGQRSFIAGELPNTPENLVRWVMDPRAVEPGTAMPDLDVDERDAQDITAYLESLGT